MAIPGTVVFGGFLLYIVLGTIATRTGIWTPRYAFSSLTADPYVVVFGFLSGLDVCIGTGVIIAGGFWNSEAE